MAGDKVSGCSSISALFQKDRLFCDPLWILPPSATFHGENSVVNFDDVGGDIDAAFFQSHASEDNGDDDFDMIFTRAGKKRRLTASQVHYLERNFEVENKLEPERKIQLAKELGLQPRQVAIWFQNRRARFKNKQLEMDYDTLKANYDRLRFDYDNLFKEKEYLKNEVISLREKFSIRDSVLEDLELLEAINLPNLEQQNMIPNSVSGTVSNVPVVASKQDDTSSANFDSDSQHSFWEPADSSLILEPDQSDFSQDEEDILSRSFMPSPCFPKLYNYPPDNDDLCTFEFPMDDQPLWSWTY